MFKQQIKLLGKLKRGQVPGTFKLSEVKRVRSNSL